MAQYIQVVVKMIPEAHVHRLNRDWEDEFLIAGCTCHGGAKGGCNGRRTLIWASFNSLLNPYLGKRAPYSHLLLILKILHDLSIL